MLVYGSFMTAVKEPGFGFVFDSGGEAIGNNIAVVMMPIIGIGLLYASGWVKRK